MLGSSNRGKSKNGHFWSFLVTFGHVFRLPPGHPPEIQVATDVSRRNLPLRQGVRGVCPKVQKRWSATSKKTVCRSKSVKSGKKRINSVHFCSRLWCFRSSAKNSSGRISAKPDVSSRMTARPNPEPWFHGLRPMHQRARRKTVSNRAKQ